MKLIKAIALIILLGTSLTFSALAQDAPTKQPAKTIAEKHRIPDGSRIFVSEMEGDLDKHISSQLTKKKLPVTLVTSEQDADYIITGASLKGDNKWYHTVFGTGKDKNEGSIQVLSTKDRTMIWAGEAGDRSLWWGRLAKGGKGKVASRLVDKMKKDLFWKLPKQK
jgi:hypothetical protein